MKQGAVFVNGTRSDFTQKERWLAEIARRLQETLLWLSEQTIISYLRNGHIKNSGLTPVDFERANKIFGPPKSILTGKMIVLT